VGDREGDADFRPEKNLSPLQGHLVEPDYALGFRTPPVPPIRVRVVSLDGFVYGEGHPAPGLVKIDVEGGEVKALAGMSRVLTEARPTVVCEVHSHDLARKAALFLQRTGYAVSDLEEGTPGTVSPDRFTRRRYLLGMPEKTG